MCLEIFTTVFLLRTIELLHWLRQRRVGVSFKLQEPYVDVKLLIEILEA